MTPVELTAALIKCPSVTPKEAGALVLLDRLLCDAGFKTRRADRNGVPNLYARFGESEPVKRRVTCSAQRIEDYGENRQRKRKPCKGAGPPGRFRPDSLSILL